MAVRRGNAKQLVSLIRSVFGGDLSCPEHQEDASQLLIQALTTRPQSLETVKALIDHGAPAYAVGRHSPLGTFVMQLSLGHGGDVKIGRLLASLAPHEFFDGPPGRSNDPPDRRLEKLAETPAGSDMAARQRGKAAAALRRSMARAAGAAIAAGAMPREPEPPRPRAPDPEAGAHEARMVALRAKADAERKAKQDREDAAVAERAASIAALSAEKQAEWDALSAAQAELRALELQALEEAVAERRIVDAVALRERRERREAAAAERAAEALRAEGLARRRGEAPRRVRRVVSEPWEDAGAAAAVEMAWEAIEGLVVSAQSGGAGASASASSGAPTGAGRASATVAVSVARAALEALRDALECPITREPMAAPVVAADGHTYDARSIEGWLATGAVTSPLTGQALRSTTLQRNHALKHIATSLAEALQGGS